MSNSFGKPKYGGEQFKKTGKPAKGPGNNFIRVLPPMFSLADEGRWAIYRTTHWGYAGVSPADKTKNIVRPFLCIEERDRRSKMTTQDCPECTNFNTKKAECDALEAELKAKGTAKDVIDTKLKSRKDWLQAHGPERKWYVNVQYKDGTFGDYKINHKIHKKGIDLKIEELLRDNQIDALDPSQGVWFNIKRIGNGFDPPDVIEVEQEDLVIDGKKIPGAKTIKLAPLSDEDVTRCFRECRDLSTLGGSVLSYHQIQSLVESSGDPEEVDRIFGGAVGSTAKQGAPGHDVSGSGVPPLDDEPESVPGTRVSAPEPTSTKASGPTPEMIAKRDAILAKKAEKAAAEAKAKADAEAAAAAAAAKPLYQVETSKNPLEMDDDEYLNFFNETAGTP